MAKTMTYQEFLENETIIKSTNETLDIIKQDPVAMKMIDAAKTVEELYEATKHFITVTWEEFKKFFDCTFDYFSSPKVAVNDEMLDNVVGGWSITSFFNNLSEKARCVANIVLGVAVMAGGVGVAMLGVAFGGPVVAGLGLLVGVGSVVYGSVLLGQGIDGLID